MSDVSGDSKKRKADDEVAPEPKRQKKDESSEEEAEEAEKDTPFDPKDLPVWCKDWAVPPKDQQDFKVRLVESAPDGFEIYEAAFSSEEYARRTHEFLRQASMTDLDYPPLFVRRWLGLVVDDEDAGPSGLSGHNYGDKYDVLCSIYAYLCDKGLMEQPMWKNTETFGSLQQEWAKVSHKGDIGAHWFVAGLFEDD
jgi:hypothetical protein